MMEVIKSESIPLKPEVYKSRVYDNDNEQFDFIYQPYDMLSSSSFDIFQDLREDLTDKNWEIRQQTLVKLIDVISNQDVDLHSKVVEENFRLITINLGHVVSSVRRLALEAILAFARHSKDPDTIIKDVLTYGVDSASTDSNLSLNTIQVLPIILKYLKQQSKISHQSLAQIVISLSKRMVQITHQKQVISSLLRIKKLLGNIMFEHFFETYYPQIKRDFDELCNVYGNDYSEASDISETEADLFFIPEDDTEELHAEKKENINDSERQQEYLAEVNSDDEVIMKVYDEDGNEIKRTSSRRVTFGGEIVKIRTPDSDAIAVANGTNEKLDISADIVVQISSDESAEGNNESTSKISNKCDTSKIKCSHIPLPIRPALNKPSHPRLKFQPFTQPTREVLNGSKSKEDKELLMDIPNYDGESLTSSSDSSDRIRTRIIGNLIKDQKKITSLKQNVVHDLNRMKINDKIVLENLFKKDNWRFYVCGVERLSQILRQPFCIQNISSSIESTSGVSLLCFIFNVLVETKNHKVVNASLRVLRLLCQAMQSSTLTLYLSTIVPTFCFYLNPNQEYNARLEAVEILKMLMRKFSPQKIVEILFTEQCFYSRSSKMRENSLLCLMYALITFPSTEFNVNEIKDLLLKGGMNEPKRRVRQALLDALSILGQLLPKSKFQIIDASGASMLFKEAVRARLSRRQLPTVSQNGLILYAFQIPSNITKFDTDIEWIMAGQGSLPNNNCRSKTQMNYIPNDDISLPLKSTEKWHSNSSKSSPIEVEIKTYSPFYENEFMFRGGSEEGLFMKNQNNLYRYSADWIDSRSTPSLFESLHSRYPSNLSDSSSYESSYTSEQNFPKLQPRCESSSFYLQRPVSEDKLHHLPWSRRNSKLPLRSEPTRRQFSKYYDYNTSCSLPALNMKNGKKMKNFYQVTTKKENIKSNDQEKGWMENRTHLNSKSIMYFENQTEKIKIGETSAMNTISEGQIDLIETSLRAHKLKKKENYENGSSLSNSNENCEESKTEQMFVQSITNCNEINNSVESKERVKKFLERKAGVKLKRSLTKEIKMPQSTFNFNPNDVTPYEYPKDAFQKILLQFDSNDWKIVIEALQGVIRLAKHHSKQFMVALHPYAIAVSKEIRNLRSQVSRAACLSAEHIFKNIPKISDQDIEELSHALFLRTADTNKFLREDSNKALDAMIDNIKFSKAILILTQKAAKCPNALIRASAARLMNRLLLANGSHKILSLNKEKKELVINTVVKFLMDGNLETRSEGKKIIQFLMKNKRMLSTLSEIIPNSILTSINKSLLRS